MASTLPVDPVASEPVPVCYIGAALHWFSVRHGHVGSLLSLLTDDDIELYGFTFTHAPLDLVHVVPGDRHLVDEDVLMGVVASAKAAPIPNVKQFDCTVHLFISAAAAALCQMELSVLPVLTQSIVIR